ncbi:MAG: NADH-quinone oxidoreductase subunit M [Chloroflexota bacterium]
MSDFGLPILSILVFLPLVGAIAAMFMPRTNESLLRAWAVAVSLAVFVASLGLWFGVDPTTAKFQWLESFEWVPGLGITYQLGVDGISLLLVLLTTFLMPLVFIYTASNVLVRVKEFVVLMLVLETAMLGTFLALDLFLFYVFWELMLVPMYFLIGVWGGPRRIYAAVKFFLYTMAGSVLMLLAIMTLYFRSGTGPGLSSKTFNLLTIMGEPVAADVQPWLFAAFALAFAIKVPMFPFHTWLPDAHVEAPTAGSVILAAVLLKMGTYGFLRFCLPLFPDAAVAAAPLFALLAVIGIIYGALVATMQRDMKKLVAYSSVSHLGFVMLGLFAFTPESMQGSLLQMVNHGISTGALFLLVGMIYDRAHTRYVHHFGGVAKVMPVFAALFSIVLFSSLGLPGTNGFVGEFLILVGTFKQTALGFQPLAIVGASGVVLGAVYMLWMYQRALQGPVREPEVDGHRVHLTDLTSREILVLVPFIVLIFWIGIYPKPFLDRTAASITSVSEQLQRVVDTSPTALASGR